ncbi:ral guanine nucleotide dissociation stimulator-like isoform X3 [Dipodomys merriami]|uniref:ral guanine nucleotide dissociation stimulator-like isoform X3 n=1 Tax=Dipodomys merriami TaxID=94247 RepID=UPI003855C040
MPTVVVMDVSLSMTRPVSIEGSEEYQRKHLAAHGLTMLFEHMATNYKLEFTGLVVFSSLWELMVPFTRDYNTLQCANASALSLNVPCDIWSPEAGLLDMLVMNLVPAYQKGDLFYVGNFLHNYRQWGTMQQVLDIVFKKFHSNLGMSPSHMCPVWAEKEKLRGDFLLSSHRYRFPGRNWEEDEQVKNTLCSIFTMWMDCYRADFREPQNRHPVKELTHYAMLHMPSSDLVLQLHILLDELEETGKKETKKQRKKSLCGHLRACFGRHRAASPDLPRKKPSVMSGMVMDGDLEPSLDSTKHVHVEGLHAFAVRPQKVVIPVDKTLVVNPTCDRVEPVETPKKEESNSDCLPLTFTGGPDQRIKGQISTSLGVLEGVAHVGLMENVPSLCSGEPTSEVPTLDAAPESESVLTEHLDKSVLMQHSQSPTEKLVSASPATAGATPIIHEEVDPLEDSEAEFMFDGNLEAGLDLELPSPLPGVISLFLFVLIVVKCAFFLFFSIY